MSKMPNVKCQMSNLQSGFTLIELLAVSVVLVSAGAVIVSILFSSLRSTDKANAVNIVRSNGNYAISQIGKMTRSAKRLESPYPCILPPSPTPIPTYSSISIRSHDDGITTFKCNSVTDNPKNTIASNGASLLDTTQVNTYQCRFTCRQRTTSDYPTIEVYFSVYHRRQSGAAEQKAFQEFKTSVTMRGLTR